MRRVTKYKKLQFHMMMNEYEYEDIAKCLGRSKDYVGRHLRMEKGFTFPLDEAYKILELMKIPREKIFEYFPPNGDDIREVFA